MRQTLIILFFGVILFTTSCRKPDILKQEGRLKIENTSESNYITGVYFGTVGYGNNRISSNIGPGESVEFTLDIEDDDSYDIKVTSDMTGYEIYTKDHYSFGWDETYIVELTDNGWYID